MNKKIKVNTVQEINDENGLNIFDTLQEAEKYLANDTIFKHLIDLIEDQQIYQCTSVRELIDQLLENLKFNNAFCRLLDKHREEQDSL